MIPAVTRARSLAGQELKYAEITSNFVYSTDNNPADITGLTITFTPLQPLVAVRAGGYLILQSVTASSPYVQITDGAGVLQAMCSKTVHTGALNFPFSMIQKRLSLTPGTSYTFKCQIGRGLAGASTVTLAAAAGFEAWIQAVYL